MGCLSSKNTVDVAPVTTSSATHSDFLESEPNVSARNGNSDDKMMTPAGSAKSRDSGFVDRNSAVNADSIQKPVLPAIKSSTSSQAAQSSSVVHEERLAIVREEEGMMIQRSLTSTAFGYSFEVIDAEDEGRMPRRRPVRLAKLEGKRRIITDDEIRKKLELADKRRQHQEQLRLKRIRALQLSDVNSANETMIASQNEAAQAAKLKSQAIAENRDRLLRERRSRMASAGRLRKSQDQPASPDILNHRPVQHSPRDADDVMNEPLNDPPKQYTNTLEASDHRMGSVGLDTQNEHDYDEVDHSRDKLDKDVQVDGYSVHTTKPEVVEKELARHDIVIEQSVLIGPHQAVLMQSEVLSRSGEKNNNWSTSDNDTDSVSKHEPDDVTLRQLNGDVRLYNFHDSNNNDPNIERPKSPVANDLVLSSSPNSFGASSSLSSF